MEWDTEKLEELLKDWRKLAKDGRYPRHIFIQELEACQVEEPVEMRLVKIHIPPSDAYECTGCHWTTCVPLMVKPNYCSHCGLPRKPEEEPPAPKPGDRKTFATPDCPPGYEISSYFRSGVGWHSGERKGQSNRRVQLWDIVRCPACSKLHSVPLPDRRKEKP